MASRTANFCLDAHDPRAQAAWWAQVLDDFVPLEDGDEDEAGLRGPAGREMLFLRVPEAKTVKNRLHLDFRPAPVDGQAREATQAVEVERLESLGAVRAQVGQDDADVSWVVLADPEGNEFCVL